MDILVFGQSASAAKAQAAGYAVARDKADLFERSDVLPPHGARAATRDATRHRHRQGSRAHGTDRAPGQYLAGGVNRAVPSAHALRKGRPGYAAVDVYEQEPIMNGDHPLLSMPNVLCMLHRSAGRSGPISQFYLPEAFEQSYCSSKARRCGLAIRMSLRGGDRSCYRLVVILPARIELTASPYQGPQQYS